MQKIILPSALAAWAKAVSTCDPDAVLKCYDREHPNVSIKGTLATTLVRGVENVRAYFSNYFFKNRKSLSCEFNTVRTRTFGHCQLHQGLYSFMLEDQDGRKQKILARFKMASTLSAHDHKQKIFAHRSYLVKSADVRQKALY